MSTVGWDPNGINVNGASWNNPSASSAQDYDFNTFKPTQPIVNSPATPAMPAAAATPGLGSATPATPATPLTNSFSPQYENNGWNPSQYATNGTANQLAGMLGGSVMRTDTSMNPGGAFSVPSQNMIDLGGEDGLNAGLLAQRYASMPKAQADALTQAELATMGRRTTTNDQAQANATTAGGTPTYAGRGATSPASPLAQQAFASANGMPKGLAYQAGYNANGQLMPSASQFGQQQSQYAQNQQNDQGVQQQQQFMQQIQQLMPILQMLGGFGRGGQGINLSQLFGGMPQQQQHAQRTPYGYTQWNGDNNLQSLLGGNRNYY